MQSTLGDPLKIDIIFFPIFWSENETVLRFFADHQFYYCYSLSKNVGVTNLNLLFLSSLLALFCGRKLACVNCPLHYEKCK